jgi:hypothetical protein
MSIIMVKIYNSRIIKQMSLISNLYLFTPVQNVKVNLPSIVHKDVFNKIGLKYISLNVLVKCLKQEILFF